MSTLESICLAINNKILLEDPSSPTISWNMLKDALGEDVPNIEIDLSKFKGAGYINQRDMQWSFFFNIKGRLRKNVQDGNLDINWTREDKVAIANYAMQTVNRIYTLLDDKQNGTWSCPGFIMFGEFPEVWVDTEIAPGLATFEIAIQAFAILKDTEEE